MTLPSTAPKTGRPRVLAVDDEQIMRTVVDRILSDAGLDVTAVDADEAIALLDDEDFELVLCDRSMPGISGQDFLDRVRSNPRFDFTPFLFLTVSDEIENLVAGLGAGADDYITKPFHPSELVARVSAHLERAELRRRRENELVDIETFAYVAGRELTRARNGGRGGALAIVTIPSLRAVGSNLGDRERRNVLEAIAAVMSKSTEPLDILGATRHGDIAIVMPDSTVKEAADRLRLMATHAASMVTYARGLAIRPVPMIGFVEFENGHALSDEVVFRRAAQAGTEAESTQDLQPRLWLPPDPKGERPKNDHRPVREIAQVGSTFTLGIIVPFLLYLTLYALGIDVSWVVYIVVVLALVSTAGLIWLEGFYATKHPGAPEVAGEPEPPATAIICAYLPNEAATIVETVERFLEVDYPAGLQIIVAYNTPNPLPVEAELEALAADHEHLLLLEVENSNSKAQNLNAALARANGAFVGVFDADHHPEPDSYHRAWRWLSNGYDVVQGHCLVRNPEESFLARMVAVEFETIYSVAHPGRWLRDGFGIFGGSNGYWKTEVLHMTRMRGSMLTEDIDASMRVLEAGGQIASDPGLISRELATTTARQIWNQRLRWAQGWTQVSLRHLWRMVRLPHFGTRQKFGAFMLLFQREIYPWLSIQIFPLLAFWWVRGDLIDWLVPIFVAATVFTTAVGPGMTLVAYKVSHPSIKRKSWFLQYVVFSTLIYTEAKNVIARVAHLKEMMGESSWRVTPRSADPASAAPTPSAVSAVFQPAGGATHGVGSEQDGDAVLVAIAAARRANLANVELAFLDEVQRTTASCQWCNEARLLSVDRCPRCGHTWDDAPPPKPGGPSSSDLDELARKRRRRTFVAAAAAAATVAVFAFNPSADVQASPTAVPATDLAALPPVEAVAEPVPPVTEAPPSTTVAPATTVPTTAAPPAPTTTTLAPLPATDPVALDALTLGAFALGPFDFGSAGEQVAGRLVATWGQPDARRVADEQWGLCPGETGRVLEWGGLSAIFRQDASGETFVGYRYANDDNALGTISGMHPGMRLDEARALYPASVLTTGELNDGTTIFLLLRSSDHRTLLWGPTDGTTIEAIHSYRPCDRGPFPG
jgi:cellulose synthase/poly-beta-1,6-N-acetylglucosamine synthase-like glycosyltransferase/CheY-like chemotaxis protein/GGDEF domain-containing protein